MSTKTHAQVLQDIDAIRKNPKFIRMKNKNRTKNEIQIYNRMKRDLDRLEATLKDLEKSIPSADRRAAVREATANPKPKHRAPQKKETKIAKRPNWRNQPKKVAWRNQGDVDIAKNDYTRDESKHSQYQALFGEYQLNPSDRKPIRTGGPVPKVRKPRMPTITDEEVAQLMAKREAKKRARLRRKQLENRKRQAASDTVVRKPVIKHTVVRSSKYKPDPENSYPRGSITVAKPPSPKKVVRPKTQLPIVSRKPRARKAKPTGIPVRRKIPQPHPLEKKLRDLESSSSEDSDEVSTPVDAKPADLGPVAPRRRMPRKKVSSIVKKPKIRRPPPLPEPEPEDLEDGHFESYEDDLDNFDDSVSDLDASDME